MGLENSLISLSFFFLFTGLISGQSKFEYGLGIGINHSGIDENIKTISGPGSELFKGLRLPALMTRIGYKINDRFHINVGPGFSWLGSLQKDFSSRLVASTFEVPLQVEWNPWHNIHLSTGSVYNYIIGISNKNDLMDFDLLPLVDSRQQIGLRHGISFSHRLIEFSLNYTHYLTEVFNSQLTDVNGNIIGTSVSKFRNIQLGIIFRR